MLKQCFDRIKKFRLSFYNHQTSKPPAVDSVTFSDLLDQWMDYERIQETYALGTMNNYLSCIHMLKRMEISKKGVSSVTTDDLQEFFRDLACGYENSRGNQIEGYSHSHILSYSAVLHAAFRYAVYPAGLITSSPMENVELKRISPPEPMFAAAPAEEDCAVLTEQQFRALEAFLQSKNNPALLPIQIAYYTGLRLGEVCGLAWSDINLKEQYLTVRRSVMMNRQKNNRMEFTVPKRGKIRVVEFGDRLTEILKENRERQSREKAACAGRYFFNFYVPETENRRVHYLLTARPAEEPVPDHYRNIDLVCIRGSGAFESRRTVSCVCTRLKKQIPGMEQFHFHMLRHTYTTRLLEKGASPKEVQELLGHSDIRTTMNVYAHADREEKRRIVRLLDSGQKA